MRVARPPHLILGIEPLEIAHRGDAMDARWDVSVNSLRQRKTATSERETYAARRSFS